MSLAATKIQELRVANPNFDKNMARLSEYGALDFFVSQNNSRNALITKEMYNKAFMSVGNTVKVPAINYDGDVTVSSARSCVISDDENTSALYEVTWATYQVGFTMTPALYMTNEITYQHDFERKMNKVIRALGASLDTAAIAALEAQKTQVIGDQLNYTFSSNVLNAANNMATEIMGDIEPIMRTNDYFGETHIICNAGIDSIMRKLAQHSVNNDVNKVLEYAGKKFHYTNRLTNANGKCGTFFAVEDGNVGILFRADREALRGTVANGHEWSVINMPYLGIPMGLHYYTAVGDQSGIAGEASADMTCNVKEYWGFSIDVAFIVAYNNAPSTIANPIIKAQIASGTGPLGMPVYVTNASEFGE